jgi:hypothetical protein
MLRLIACLISLSFATEVPFWKSKAKVYERIQNGEVIVSVSSQRDVAPESPRHRLKAAGGGIVAAPCPFVFEIAQNYAEVARLSGYISRAEYDAKTRTLDLTLSAFFYTTTMKVAVHPLPESKPPRLEFTLISGPMKGFQYQMIFSDLDVKKCEVGMEGSYKYDSFPIPRIFLEFGMESMLQSMAKRLRAHAEEHWTSTPRS